MTAVSELNIPVLAVFAAGCLIGILAFSKCLHWLLSKWERETLLVLIGFTIGTLVKVWPWADKVRIATAHFLHMGMTPEAARKAVDGIVEAGVNPLTTFSLQIGSAIMWCITGAVLVLALEWLGKSYSREKNPVRQTRQQRRALERKN